VEEDAAVCTPVHNDLCLRVWNMEDSKVCNPVHYSYKLCQTF